MNRNTIMSALLASSILASPVLAQEAENTGLDEILVVARKKSENIQDVPIAITALSGEALESKGIRSLDEVAFRVPNLTFRNTSDLKLSPISLRGVSADTGSAGQDPSVATYVDEIFLGTGVGSNIAYYDLEAVEVLRGPQGTLFGRNAIGGVVNIRTRRPTFDTTGYAEAEVGNYNQVRVSGAIGGGLIGDTLAARVAGSFERRDGFTKLVNLGETGDNRNNWNLRGQLLFKPTENMEWLLSGEYREVQQSSRAFETLVNVAGSPNTDNLDPNDRRTYPDEKSRETFDGYRIALRGNIDLGAVKLATVTGFRRHNYDSRTDTDNTPLRLAYDGDPEKVSAFSQELRLSGGDDKDTLSWLIGGFYYNQKTKNLSYVDLGQDLTGAPDIIRGGSDAEVKVESYAAFASATIRPFEALSITLGGRFTKESKSIVYSQLDQLGLFGGTFGVNDPTQPINDPDLPNFNATKITNLSRPSKKYNNFSPNLNISYKVSDDVMLYANASRGFKSGGFNDALGTVTGVGFDPEIVTSGEVGIKSELLDRRLRLNLAAFYLKWNDILVSLDNPDTPILDPSPRNAGTARSYGLEAEIEFKASDRLSLNANMALLEARFTGPLNKRFTGQVGVDGVPIPGAGYTLDRQTDAPRFTASASFTYRMPLRDDLFVSFSPEVTYKSSQLLNLNAKLQATDQNGVRQTGLAVQKGFAMVNGTLTLDTGEDNGLSAGLWVKNLTNQLYKTRVFDLRNPPIGQIFQVLGPPRTIGVFVKYDF